MWRRLGMIILAVGFMGGGAPVTAQNPDGVVAVIMSPVEGQQLFGPTNITGSAGHPTAFSNYTLEYDALSDPAEQWFLVQEPVYQQVQDGVLGTWNTNMVPDGAYRLRLRVVLNDGQIGESVISNLRVINTEPTPVPTLPAASGDTTLSAPTPGPSPTSPIVQPPSNNPPDNTITGLNPAADEPLVLGESENTQDDSSARINFSRVRSAFCSGVYLAIGAFAVMLVYALIRGRLRPWTRRMIWQDDSDQYS